MNPTEIYPGRAYRGCPAGDYHVEKVEDGLVYFRMNGRGTLVSIDLDTFSGLMRHELRIDEGRGD